MVTIGGRDTPFGPGSTVRAVAIVTATCVRIATLFVEGGSIPRVSRRANAVEAERWRTLNDEAYREHARRLARAIDRQGGE